MNTQLLLSGDLMKKAISIIWHTIVFILVILGSILYRDTLEISDVEPLVNILQNTSAMVFTIMGIWIAYLYPNAIMSIIQPDKVDTIFSEGDEKRVSLIVGVVALSAFVMCSLILLTALTPLVYHSSLYMLYPLTFKGLGLFFLFSLSYAQVFAIYVVFASNVDFIIRLRNFKKKRRLNERLSPKMDSNEPK